MAALTIPDLDPVIEERLRARAAAHGVSLEDEVSIVLAEALASPAVEPNLYDRIRSRFEPFGGVDDLVLPMRDRVREPPLIE